MSDSVCVRRAWQRVAIWALALGAVWVLVVLALQRSMLFPSHAARPHLEAGRGIAGLERLHLAIDDGEVEAWLLPGDGATGDSPGPALVFAHGNAELIDHRPDEMQRYRELGFTVLLPEYRGYGRSAGAPSEEAIRSDLVAFHDQLAARAEVDATRIVFHGRSLGGGAVCALARDREPRALILQSTFTSVADLAGGFLVPPFLVLDPFDNEEVVRSLDVPKLILHGRRDELVPPSHAERLAGTDAHLVWYDAGHNDFPPDRRAYWRDIESFLRDADVVR